MILKINITSGINNSFTVPVRIIWSSALFIGILASIPKILQLHITFTELAVDASVAFLYSLFVWYFNIFSLPKYTHKQYNNRFFNLRLAYSLLIGIALMLILVGVHQLLFPQYHFQSMIMMYEFRGVLINLTIYMFLYLLYQSYKMQLAGIELERLKSDNLSAQYELLKQQVNPHFLFNSLSTLKSMIEIGDNHSIDFILKLSDFYRYTLENRKQHIILFEDELRILNAYIYLLKARFEDGIKLTDKTGTETNGTFIPPFTLQLLVENCIKHNAVSLETPLSINLFVENDHLVISNQLQEKTISEISTGMGLENINERYMNFTGHPIIVEKTNTHFTVKMPLIHEYPNY